MSDREACLFCDERLDTYVWMEVGRFEDSFRGDVPVCSKHKNRIIGELA